tara:strand:- start:2595 stop:3020 length:426 start_codon:yes stop_codon:yes gene_type:complete
MDNSNLYKSLGFERKTTTKSTNGKTTLEGTIKQEINDAVHDMLLEKYPHLYKDLDTTQVVKQDSDGKVKEIKDMQGYRLLIPINDKVELKNGDNKVVLANAVKVADPQIYLQGIQHFVCEYVKIGGKTTTWNTKSNDFTSK